MDTPIQLQVNGSRDPFPIPFRKFNNLWYDMRYTTYHGHAYPHRYRHHWNRGSLTLAPIIDCVYLYGLDGIHIEITTFLFFC